MTIGINVTAAGIKPRTGVEEYVYQLISHLAMLEQSQEHRFVLYTPDKNLDFSLPSNFAIKTLRWPGPMWTQARLAGEMILHPPEALFIPVHILPLAHPRNCVVCLHGAEYEYWPEMYPARHRAYLRWSTKYALSQARKIIAISESTKKDLVNLYGGDPEKISVIHHGFSLPAVVSAKAGAPRQEKIVYLGRLETRKNVPGLVRAFDLFKNKYGVPHKLVLAGARGYGYGQVRSAIARAEHKKDIIESGYISAQEKWQVLRSAALLALVSFREGFGLPVLEAQACGCPVLCADNSSLPEVAGAGACFVDAQNIDQIAEAMYKIISDENLRSALASKGYENAKRFSWDKCARQTLAVLTES